VTERSTKSRKARYADSVWRCRWCRLEYRHPITGAISVGHFCEHEKLRTLTRSWRSRYDREAAQDRR
jgi:hypothetical protein